MSCASATTNEPQPASAQREPRGTRAPSRAHRPLSSNALPSPAGMARWRIGVDVGGTFTDVAILNADTGDVLVDKVPTTLANPALCIIGGLDRRLAEGVEPAAITSFLHGTTITTNALLEMKGVPVGLLLTAGLRGIAEVQSGLRDG